MKIGSLFDGSGGFPLAASLCGMTPTFASEVEPYPIAVTTSRFPNMRHLGDITKINGAEIEPVHVLSFGSPCQDLSTAGRRKGLKHSANGDDETTRSGLFMEAVRIIKEMRRATNGEYPKFAIWENVPGAFSSNKGEDFRVVLEELVKICEPEAPPIPSPGKAGWPYADCIMGDGWSLAWRLFDAQYWPGTPQRRKRIYLVLDLTGSRAEEILFERPGLRGYPETLGTPWEEAPCHARDCSEADDTASTESGLIPYTLKIRSGCEGGGKGALIQENLSATLATNNDQYLFQPIAVATQQGGAEVTENGICPTITASAGMSGNNQPWVCCRNAANHEKRCKNAVVIVDQIGGQGEYYQESDVSSTLRAGGLGAVCYDARGNGKGHIAPTITGDHNGHVSDYTALACYCMATGQANAEICKNISPCLNCNHEQPIVAESSYIVRRLIPIECARLQGFPDTWGYP